MNRYRSLKQVPGFLYRGVLLLAGALLLALIVGAPAGVHASNPHAGHVFASSNDFPDLAYPEGITSWHDKVYVATFNFAPNSARILVFNADNGNLVRTLGN